VPCPQGAGAGWPGTRSTATTPTCAPPEQHEHIKRWQIAGAWIPANAYITADRVIPQVPRESPSRLPTNCGTWADRDERIAVSRFDVDKYVELRMSTSSGLW
jgi:hypothetical protein